jgi:hypothetical protein
MDVAGRTFTRWEIDVANGHAVIGFPQICKEVPLGIYILAVELNGEFASLKLVMGNY